jgi:hypothetical protein
MLSYCNVELMGIRQSDQNKQLIILTVIKRLQLYENIKYQNYIFKYLQKQH